MRADPVRLAVGTFSRLPVPPPSRMDASVARHALLLAPVVGAALGLMAGLVAWIVDAAVVAPVGPFLGAVVGLTALAWATRALHWDGLADTADALGSGRAAAQALEIARRSDIGPFGVVTLVLVLLTQVAALAGTLQSGVGVGALVIAATAGRLAVVLACARGIPAARPDGLGAAVAGTVPRAAVIVLTIVVGAAAASAMALAGGSLAAGVIAVLGGVLAAGVLVRLCVRRLGGITGDVLGAAVEIATAVALVILVAVPA